VLDVARAICAIFGLDDAKHITHVRDRAFNDQRYYISDAKMINLGWREEVEWECGLKQTVDWYASTTPKQTFICCCTFMFVGKFIQ
jgi:UDP-glucose 4,6-dehydratase